MNFVILDIILLVLFLALAGFFLYRNRKKLDQEGWLLLYKTSWGIKLINRIGKKYEKTLRVLSYISVAVGMILMILVLILMIQTVYLYLTTTISETIKAPPIMPLIPYFPEIFGVKSIFPPFYFVYFIISILIVATFHEFFHGIFAARYKIKIKSTGFAFLKYFPAFFGAFVEQDDKQMRSKKKFEQMSVLSAGVFANVLIVLIFGIVFVLFFKLAFVPSGIVYDSYPYSIVEMQKITKINGIEITNISFQEALEKMKPEGFNEIEAKNKYIITKVDFEKQESSYDKYGKVLLYYDAPAIKSNLSRIIYAINGVKIENHDILVEELAKYSPGEKITVTTVIDSDHNLDQDIILGENPENGKSWMGIGFVDRESNGVKGFVVKIFSFVKDPNMFYTPRSELSVFIYNLLWWILMINFLVALFNMLPLGILDGGRFFYLGVLSVTKSEKFAKRAFQFATYFLLALLLVLMIKWAISVF